MLVAPSADVTQHDERQLGRTHDPVTRRADSPLAVLPRRSEGAAQTPVVGRILEAATQAVADCGLNGLSMEDVAVRAGCSRATVYRRVGGKDALRDALLGEAIGRITTSVVQAVDQLDGNERVVRAIAASLDTIRADPVSAALLAGPQAGQSVSSLLITQVSDNIARLTGVDPGDGIRCQLIARMTLSLLCWPALDRSTELAVIRRLVFADRPMAPYNWRG